MIDKFVVAVCTLGEDPNLLKTLAKLIEIKRVGEYDVDILVVIKESVFNIECESTDGLVRGYFPGASRPGIGEGVAVGFPGA
jgi:hypothetical protein